MGEEKNKKNIELYIAPFKRRTITVFRLGNDDKKVPMVDELSGVHKRVDGRPQYEEETVTFVNTVSKASLGFESVYQVTSETPKHIAEALAKMASDPGCDIKTEKQWIKMKNPARHKEIVRREELEKEYEEKIELARKDGFNSGLSSASEKDEELKSVKQDRTVLRGENTKKENEILKLKAQVKELEKGSKA